MDDDDDDDDNVLNADSAPGGRYRRWPTWPAMAAAIPSIHCSHSTPVTRRHQLFYKNPIHTRGGSVAEWLACWTPGAEGPGFKSQSRRCRVTVTPIMPLITKQRNW